MTKTSIVILSLIGAAVHAGDPIEGYRFQQFVQYDTGDNATGIALADLDGDGDLDAIISNRDSNDVAVLLNNGSGAFTWTGSFGVGNQPRYVTVADFDGDGDIDAATSDRSSSTVSILLNNGDATFVLHDQVTQGAPDWIQAFDVDEDGDQDLFVTKFTNPHKLSILINDGAANFTVGNVYDISSGPRGGDLADIDGDGRQDLIIACVNDGTVDIFRNLGGGAFQRTQVLPSGEGARYPAAGDFDLDGDMDFAVANKNSNDLWVFRNDGAGNFVSELGDRYGLLNIPHGLEAADIDSDGDLELIACHVGAPFLVLLGNDGTGSFSTTTIASPDGPAHVVAGNFDTDDDLDVMTANTNNGSATVHINVTAQGPTRAVSLEIDVVADTIPISTGDIFDVEIWLRDVEGAEAAGFQSFLDYDAKQIEFVSGVYTDAPFGLPLIDPIAPNGEQIDLAAALDVFSGQEPTADDSRLAVLTFKALGPFCNPEIAFRFNQPPSRVTDPVGSPILPLTLVSPQTDSAASSPVLELLELVGGPYFAGETVVIQVNMSGLECAETVGFQAFLEYNASAMSFVSGTYSEEPFGLPILDPITAVDGEIDLAAGINFIDGQEPTTSDAMIVELIFEANMALCDTTIRFRDVQPPSRLTDPFGIPIEPLTLVSIEGNPCQGDISGPSGRPDGVIGFPDLLQILSNWGPCGCDADVNCSGVVDFQDLLLVLSNWGPCPGP